LEKTTETKTIVPLKSSEETLALLGHADKHLKTLRKLLPAQLLARGHEIQISGQPEDVRLAERVVRDLVTLVRQGAEIDAGTLEQVILVAENGQSLPVETSSPALGEMALPGRLKPKTSGQRQYVEAIATHDITFGIGPAGTGKCVAADTWIWTGCGTQQIGELGRETAPNQYQTKPTKIYGLQGEEWASHVYNGGFSETRKVTVRHGFGIEGTPEHPLLTMTPEGEVAWVQMKDIQPGMYLALTRGANLFGTRTQIAFEYQARAGDTGSQEVLIAELDTELAYALGLMVGGGCLTRRGWVLFSTRDPELLEAFARLAERFDLSVCKHGQDYRINSVQLYELLMQLGLSGGKAETRVVPKAILQAPRDRVLAFLQGLFDTDGSIDSQVGYIRLSSASEALARGVQLLLLNLEIIAHLRCKATTHLPAFVLEIRGAEADRFLDTIGFRLKRKQSRRQYRLRNTNCDVIPHVTGLIDGATKAQRLSRATHKRFYYRIGRRNPSYPKLGELLTQLGESPEQTRLQWLYQQNLLWSEVTEVEASQAQVYDLTVPGSHSFTANGFVSHNTYLAVAMAVAFLKAKKVKRIILTRPAVEAGERLGFLPGDLQAKIDPYLRPLYDAIFEMIDAERFDQYLQAGIIEVAPLAFMRGRTLNDAFIILDEAQNTTPEQMKMFLTRMGFNSRVVITGDITQIDLPKAQKSGLIEAMRILKGIQGIAQQYFRESDVVRHPLIARIIKAYELLEHQTEKSERGEP